jgi:hypothetical protein
LVTALGVPLALAVLGVEDRVYARNLVAALPLCAGLAAPALLRARALPLALYLALCLLASVWVASSWRFEQADCARRSRGWSRLLPPPPSYKPIR